MTAELDDELARGRRDVRVVSYAVRDRFAVPVHGDGRHRLYLGTGGPGHLDPRRNTRDQGVEEIREDPSWEAPLWRLFEAIAADGDAALFGVCHTFGLVCRWLGVAEPILRGPEKGGPLSGIGTNALSREALAHPWFAHLARELASDARHRPRLALLRSRADGRRVSGRRDADRLRIGRGRRRAARPHDARGGARGRRLGRRASSRFNGHPEIGTAERVAELLERLLARGAITRAVYEARRGMLSALRDERREERLRAARATFDDLVRRKLGAIVRAA